MGLDLFVLTFSIKSGRGIMHSNEASTTLKLASQLEHRNWRFTGIFWHACFELLQKEAASFEVRLQASTVVIVGTATA